MDFEKESEDILGLVSVVDILQGKLIRLSKELERVDQKVGGIPDFLPKKDLCEEEHDFILADLTLPGDTKGRIENACLKCGLVKNSEWKLNPKAIRILTRSWEEGEREKELRKKVLPIVEFEMSSFFSEWISQVGPQFLESIGVGQDPSVSHDILLDLLYSGTEHKRELEERISQEFKVR